MLMVDSNSTIADPKEVANIKAAVMSKINKPEDSKSSEKPKDSTP